MRGRGGESLYRAALERETYSSVEFGADGAAARPPRARAYRAPALLGALAVVAFLVLVWWQGADSAVGNGSQVLITFSFAISEPLPLFLVSLLGTSLQTLFFATRPVFIFSSFAVLPLLALL